MADKAQDIQQLEALESDLRKVEPLPQKIKELEKKIEERKNYIRSLHKVNEGYNEADLVKERDARTKEVEQRYSTKRTLMIVFSILAFVGLYNFIFSYFFPDISETLNGIIGICAIAGLIVFIIIAKKIIEKKEDKITSAIFSEYYNKIQTAKTEYTKAKTNSENTIARELTNDIYIKQYHQEIADTNSTLSTITIQINKNNILSQDDKNINTVSFVLNQLKSGRADSIKEALQQMLEEQLEPFDYEKIPNKNTVKITRVRLKYKNETKLEIPNYVEIIDDQAFVGCQITSIEIPSSVKIIGNKAFNGCNKLEDVIMHEGGVTSIGDSAFQSCPIKTLCIPDSVKIIGNLAFAYCYELMTVSIGNGVTTIKNGAFDNCRKLSKLTIGSSVVEIGLGAFQDCNKLERVGIPNSVVSIGQSAFENCGVIYLTLGNSVKTIGNYAFQGSKIKEITIPKSVEKIGTWAFRFTYLTTVRVSSSLIFSKSDFSSFQEITFINY